MILRRVALKDYERLEMERELQETYQRTRVQKIAILGLGKAGKTSIIKTMLYQFEDLMGLFPTKGVERTSIDFLGRELLVWDFGGQDRYIQQYFAHPERFFSGIQFLYFVVDAQDSSTIRESMSYFLKAFENCIKFSPEVKVFFFFHKIDPKFTDISPFEKIEDDFLSEVLPKIQKKLQHPPAAFHTSIYEPFSVIKAFSQPLLDNFSIYETLSKTIKQFVLEHNQKFGILFAAEFFELGHYLPKEKSHSIQELLTAFLKEFDVKGFAGTFPEFSFGNAKIFSEKFLIPIANVDFPFYISIGVDLLQTHFNEAQFRETLKSFASGLQKILEQSELIRIGYLRTENLIKTAYFDDY